VLVVDVTFRLSRTWGVPVRAEFTCPDSRTIVMRITEGEGMGSVVEAHATPLGLGADGRPRTMVTEATVAYSERPGFHVARWLSPLLRPGIRHTARKLWDDARGPASAVCAATARRVPWLITHLSQLNGDRQRRFAPCRLAETASKASPLRVRMHARGTDGGISMKKYWPPRGGLTPSL
jgi:hypothetical protein